MTAKRTAVLTAAALFAVYVVWGSTYLAIAVALESIPPLLLMAVRSVTAGAILYAIARAVGAARPNRAAWRNAALTGTLFFVVGHGLLAWGETRVASGAAAVVIATEPLFIVLLGWCGRVLTRRPSTGRPAPVVLAAVLMGLAGVAALMLPRGAGAFDPVGIAALVAASFSWSVGTFHVVADGSPIRAAGMQLLAGGSILLVISALAGEPLALDMTAVTARSILALAYLVVLGSVVTFGAYIWLLGRIGPARLATHTFVNPLIALALGAWIGGESLDTTMLLAAALVIGAVVLLLRARNVIAGRERTRDAAPLEPRAAFGD